MKKFFSVGCMLVLSIIISGCQKQNNDIYNNSFVPPVVPSIEQPSETEKEIDTFELDLEAENQSFETEKNTKQSNTEDTKALEIETNTNTTPVSKSQTIELQKQLEPYSFNKCGTRWQFKQEDWYADFIAKLIEVPVLTNLEAAKIVGAEESAYNGAEEAMTDYGTMSETNVAYICRSTGEEIAIIMLNGNTDTTGGLMRYDIESKVLSQAPIEPYENMFLYAFTARAGSIIPVNAGIRDENCTYTYKVDYNFMTNIANPVRKCRICEDQNEKCESLIE